MLIIYTNPQLQEKYQYMATPHVTAFHRMMRNACADSLSHALALLQLSYD